ncbi:MAG: sigma-54 dependent transcriptional regulator [Thermoanaerobaculia bacterium]
MNKRTRVLVVDDESIIRESLRDWLTGAGYEILTAGSGEEALRLVRQESVKIMLADLVMPGMDGIELMKEARKIVPTISTVIITAHATVQTAITAMREGAHDYIEKPFCPERVELLLKSLLERQELIEENVSLRKRLEARRAADAVIARSPKMLSVLELVKTLAPSNATVLILGQSGTGKEVIARTIHRQSRRYHKPLIVTACATLPEGLLESELFGHEKGSFTGAVERTQGKFEAARGGTLFLDEIGEINAKTQIHLLRALEEKKITRIGSNEEIDVDVRVIAATSRDLKAMTECGQFREDLYYRLNVMTIELPPLRERKEDVLPLAGHFLRRYAAENEKDVSGFSPELVELMLSYTWPGNVRELENMVERGVILTPGEEITLAETPHDMAAATPLEGDTIDAVVRNHILKVLRQADGNISEAARILGIQRMTLYNKLKKYDLKVDTACV